MFYLKKSKSLQAAALLIPFSLSLLAAVFKSGITAAFCGVSVVFVILFMPLFHGRENLWAFLTVGLSGIPVNVFLIEELFDLDFLADFDRLIFKIVWGIVIYGVLFSAEEIFFGMLIRFLRPRQNKPNI